MFVEVKKKTTCLKNIVKNYYQNLNYVKINGPNVVKHDILFHFRFKNYLRFIQMQNITTCPKCLLTDLTDSRFKYTCKNCNYEFLKVLKEENKCKYCFSTVLVKLRDYYPGYFTGKDSYKYMCYVCRREQFTRPEK